MFGGNITNDGERFQADKRWQINVSPYVFNQTNSDTMKGANAQLNFYTNDHTTVFLGDGYDNENHNRVFVGVSFTFGGHNNDDTVENLIQSPVYRNLDVNTTSNELPISDYTSFGSQQLLSADNLWYVNNSDALLGSEEGVGIPYEGDGTYEDPYSSMSAITEENTALPNNADIRVASTGIIYGLLPLKNSTINVTDSNSGAVIGIDNEEDLASGDYVPGVVTATNTTINVSGASAEETQGNVVIN